MLHSKKQRNARILADIFQEIIRFVKRLCFLPKRCGQPRDFGLKPRLLLRGQFAEDRVCGAFGGTVVAELGDDGG